MPYIEVDIELDKFSNLDLLDELADRVKRNIIKKSELTKLRIDPNLFLTDLPKVDSVDDQIRLELVFKAYDELTTTELESLFEGKLKP